MTLEQKVDRVLQIMEGSQHVPGLLQRQEKIENVLNGEANSFGLTQKVNILWRVHILVVGGMGTIFGAVISYFVGKH